MENRVLQHSRLRLCRAIFTAEAISLGQNNAALILSSLTTACQSAGCRFESCRACFRFFVDPALQVTNG
jgi:hypothetical protein